MVQPQTSLTGSFIRMLPAGLLYASSKIVKSGMPVHILDARIKPSAWKKDLDNMVNPDTFVVGISVMSGMPVLEGLKISRYVKTRYPRIRIVWGGPHPTFSPEEILKEPVKELVFYYLNGNKAVSFLGTEKELEKTKAKIFKNIAGIKKGEFLPQPGLICQHCDFNGICDYRA